MTFSFVIRLICKRLMWLLKAAVVVYLLVILGLVLFQRSLLYVPDRQPITAEAFGSSGAQALDILTSDGETLRAWYIPPLAADGLLVLYFTGNGGHLGMHAQKVAAFARTGMGVLIFDYRGFGASTGNPTEQGLYLDALSVLDYAATQFGVESERVVLFGESLGSGVAVEVAMVRPFKAVVLVSPYTSVLQRAAELYPWAPVKYVLKDRYESIRKIELIKSPLLIIHGGRDGVIPIGHGRQLLAAAPEPKQGVFVEDEAHLTFDAQWLADTIDSFLKAF